MSPLLWIQRARGLCRAKDPRLAWPWPRLQRGRVTSTLHHRRVHTKGGQEPVDQPPKQLNLTPNQCVSTILVGCHTLGVNPPSFEHLNVPKSKGNMQDEESKRRNKSWAMCFLSCSEHTPQATLEAKRLQAPEGDLESREPLQNPGFPEAPGPGFPAWV